jgi:anti-sigma factor RsiW
MKDERLIVLLDAYLDGALSAEEKRELERTLLESEAARREFWERASLHGWTHAAAKLNYGAKPAAEVAKDRRALREASFEVFVRWLRRASRFGWKVALAGSACAAAVMLWLGIRWLQPTIPDEGETIAEATPDVVASTNFIATVTRGSAVVWEGETNRVEVGSTVPSRWLRLKSGAVQIEFYNGARVILEGPAALELVSAGEARLDFGKLSARVPEPAHGFKVYTPDVTVTDLGTAFGLNLQKAQPVKLEVFEGKIEVAMESTNQPRVLNAGEGVQVSSQQMQPLAKADQVEFLTAEELARRESAELRGRYLGWRRLNKSLDNDPATLVHLNFEDQQNLERDLINRATATRAISRAMIFGCDWGEGRWPGKAALEFNSINDRVRLPVPGQFQSLTYLAWLRVDSLPNRWNAIALVDTFKAGETHWQILGSGRLELSIRVQSGKSGWDHLVSPPVITREQFGQWIQVAGVCDGKAGKMMLYLNGQPVASKPMARQHSLTLGTLELGNWSPISQKTHVNYRTRDFHGRIDEFALLSRPLSAEEIHRQYELGKPREATAVAGLAPSSLVKP